MKRFILKSLVYLSVLLGVHYFAAQRAGGHIDPYYQRFANGRHLGMILGTSRAAQGLQPEVFAETLGPDYAPIGNYSFTLGQSPYGPVYFKSIRNKLDLRPTKKKRVFIVTVDAWSISNQDNPADDPDLFRENGRLLARVDHITRPGQPNFEYLLENYSDAWGGLFFDMEKNMEVDSSGWLEVAVSMDSSAVANRTRSKIRYYSEDVYPDFSFSSTRYKYLSRTVSFLQSFGKVYLVRLPAHRKLLALEEKLIPDFRKKICSLTQDCRIPYWDLTPLSGQYLYTDGNHLYKKSGRAVSQLIAEKIRNGAQSDCSCEGK